MRLNSGFTICFWAVAICAGAQHAESQKGLPLPGEGTEHDYLFPIAPGQRGYLAGTMGELRRTHFHSGIDIRTDQRIGKPVLAANDGYVSRISINPFGYGNTLYITHENRQTTVYAHLNRIKGELADYVREEQYRAQSYRVNLFPKKGEWIVCRGDTIAYSGNSGSSGGPHLHFDIRDANNDPLNPLRFGFEEIIDNLPPIATKIALRTMDIDARVNNRFGQFVFTLSKEGKRYIVPEPILAKGRIGVEALAYDRLNGSPFRCGVNYIEMWVNDKKVFEQRIDKINFATTRDIAKLIDYKMLKKKKRLFNKLYIDDGNTLDYYDRTLKDGIIEVKDQPVSVRIVLIDTYDNRSEVVFSMRSNVPVKASSENRYSTAVAPPEVYENTLRVKVKKDVETGRDTARLFCRDTVWMIPPAYRHKGQNAYLIDLRKRLPDSMQAGTKSMALNFKCMIPPGVNYVCESERMILRCPQNALYDTIFFSAWYSLTDNDDELFSVGSYTDPLRKNITVTLKPLKAYKENAAVYEKVDNIYHYKGGRWKEGSISFSTRSFGDYTLRYDTVPPTITRLSVQPTGVRFRIKDDLSGIDAYRAHLNGSWLMMSYDPKTGLLKAVPRVPSTRIKGVLTLEVKDMAGNSNTYKTTIQ